MTRWKVLPLYPNPFSPVASARKFSTVSYTERGVRRGVVNRGEVTRNDRHSDEKREEGREGVRQQTTMTQKFEERGKGTVITNGGGHKTKGGRRGKMTTKQCAQKRRRGSREKEIHAKRQQWVGEAIVAHNHER